MNKENNDGLSGSDSVGSHDEKDSSNSGLRPLLIQRRSQETDHHAIHQELIVGADLAEESGAQLASTFLRVFAQSYREAPSFIRLETVGKSLSQHYCNRNWPELDPAVDVRKSIRDLKQATKLMLEHQFPFAAKVLSKTKDIIHKLNDNCASILLDREIISIFQAVDGACIASMFPARPMRIALLLSGHASIEDITAAFVESQNFEYVDVTLLEIPESVFELIPAVVCYDNQIIPIGEERGQLIVAASIFHDRDLLAKLEFVLNRDVDLKIGLPDPILEMTRQLYGPDSDSPRGSFIDPALMIETSQAEFPEVEMASEWSTEELAKAVSLDPPIEPVLVQPETNKQLEEFRKLWKPVDMEKEAKGKRSQEKTESRKT